MQVRWALIDWVWLAARRRQPDRAGHHFAELVFQQLGVEQLFAVLPFVQRLRFVQAFVALQADQRHVEKLRHAFGQLGLADTGRAFDEDRFFEVEAEIKGGRDLAAGDVVDRREALCDPVDGIKVWLVK